VNKFHRLTDKQWEQIAPHLPAPKKTGRPRADDRTTLDGILYMLRSGARWCDLPREFGSPTTVWRRLRQWEEQGVWESIWRAILASLDAQGKLEWAQAFLDGSFVPAKKGD
jgi:transposase